MGSGRAGCYQARKKRARRKRMADFELTPEKVREEATSFADELQTQVAEVSQAAAAISDMPMIDLEAEEKPVEKTSSLEKFSPDEQRQIKAVAEKIDITDSNQVLSYGASAQRKVSDFADGALASVRGKDMGETGQVLTSLIVELKSSTEEEKKGILSKLFGSAEKNFEKMKAQYSSTEANIDKLVKLLEGHEEQLLKDIVQLDKLYEKNKLYFKEVSMYIEAGKLRLEKARNEKLPALQAKAKETNSPEDAQAAQDFADMITRFEKKLYDLELSRTVCLQSAPEIRMVQNADTIMSEKIRSTIINVIPMWKTQMVLALNNYHTQKAVEAQNAVTEATNEMLRKNAEALHQSTVETAKASERGIVDIETLQHTNQELIGALDEIIQIQSDGKVARANAEKELARIEQELKDKMLGIAANAGMTPDEILDAQVRKDK